MGGGGELEEETPDDAGHIRLRHVKVRETGVGPGISSISIVKGGGLVVTIYFDAIIILTALTQEGGETERGQKGVRPEM